jgi:hypothetical protein
MATPNDRSDVAERRAQLRALDIALCHELSDAGALTFQELRDQISGRKLLHARASEQTIWEWWHYALRRGIIESGAEASEMTLSARGHTRLVEAERADASSSAPKARAVLRYLAPPGLTGLIAAGAVGVLNGSTIVAVVTAAVIVIALMYWLIAEVIDYLFAKRIDPWFRRALLRTSVAWLDGDEVRGLGITRHDAVGERAAIKRLRTPALPSDRHRAALRPQSQHAAL